MGKNKENLNIFLLHFLERLNSNEPNERKVIESLTDFCNYYDFTKGFIYQTDGFRYFLLKETIGNEGGTMKPRFDMGELKKEHVDAMKARINLSMETEMRMLHGMILTFLISTVRILC